MLRLRLFSNKSNFDKAFKKSTVVKNVKLMTQKKGLFIVIEGADGCGKATQTKMLADKKNKDSHTTHTIDFPRKDSFFGKLIYEGLAGDYGEFGRLHPKVASLFWAVDRAMAATQIRAWLDSGKDVIADRYVSANMLHQGGKIKDDGERKEFFSWLEEMEYGQFNIPRPDIVLYLDVPYEISLQMIKNRTEKQKAQGEEVKTDQHESSPEHQLGARASALAILADSSWVRIQCSDNGTTLLPEEVIHSRICDYLDLFYQKERV